MSFRSRFARWKKQGDDFREFPMVIVIRGGLPGGDPTPADVARARAKAAEAGQRFVIVGSPLLRPVRHAVSASSLVAITRRLIRRS